MNFFNMGPGEIILILVLALIVFGPAKLPEIGRSVGRGIGEFRRATSELTKELSGTVDGINESLTDAGTATATIKLCPRCHTANPGDNVYCSDCGAFLASDHVGDRAIGCPQCNTLNQAGNKFCRACGTRLPALEEPAPSFAPPLYPAAVPDVPQLPQAETTATESESVAVEGEPVAVDGEPSLAQVAATLGEPATESAPPVAGEAQADAGETQTTAEAAVAATDEVEPPVLAAVDGQMLLDEQAEEMAYLGVNTHDLDATNQATIDPPTTLADEAAPSDTAPDEEDAEEREGATAGQAAPPPAA